MMLKIDFYNFQLPTNCIAIEQSDVGGAYFDLSWATNIFMSEIYFQQIELKIIGKESMQDSSNIEELSPKTLEQIKSTCNNFENPQVCLCFILKLSLHILTVVFLDIIVCAFGLVNEILRGLFGKLLKCSCSQEQLYLETFHQSLFTINKSIFLAFNFIMRYVYECLYQNSCMVQNKF